MRYAILLAAPLLFLGACGSSDDQEPSSAPSQGATIAPRTGPTSIPLPNLKVVPSDEGHIGTAPLYLALGWVAIAVLPDILHRGGVAALVLLFVGGAAYSVGAIFYALRRPNPWPNVFGHHEFFHACTVVAALCHHIAIYFALYA